MRNAEIGNSFRKKAMLLEHKERIHAFLRSRRYVLGSSGDQIKCTKLVAKYVSSLDLFVRILMVGTIKGSESMQAWMIHQRNISEAAQYLWELDKIIIKTLASANTS